MKLNRIWEMPNSKTFRIVAFRELILKYAKADMTIIDPFANEHSIKDYLSHCKYISNDLDPQYQCDYNMEAQDFMKMYDDCSIDLILYDPPYSGRQVSEVYKKLEKTVNMQDTNSGYYTKFKSEIARILKPGGICISFGWQSNGIGINNNMDIIEILLVAHGGNHNDTIATVDKKAYHQERLDIWEEDKMREIKFRGKPIEDVTFEIIGNIHDEQHHIKIS